LFGVVRAAKDGRISVAFTFRYRFGGAHRDLRCGSWPDSTLKEIRAVRDRAKATIASGLDPTLERRAEKAQRDESETAQLVEEERLTVLKLFERWEQLALSTRKDKGAEIRRCFMKDVIPRIGSLPVEKVTRPKIAALLDEVVARGARIIARNLLGDLRQMFGFAIVRGYLETDPTSHMKRDDFGKKVERDRVLSEAEIRELASKIPEADLSPATRLSIWLMLSTCCRIGELSQSRWTDVDLEAGVWTIPAQNAKNAKTHRVYLSPFATALFVALREVNGTVVDEDGDLRASDWCFPGTYGRQPLGPKALSKQIRDRQRPTLVQNRSKKIGTLLLSQGSWTPHDLRRSGATLMGSLGVRPDVIEKCLNHVEQNRMKRIYQRQELKAEQAEAWRILGERLSTLVSAPGVLSHGGSGEEPSQPLGAAAVQMCAAGQRFDLDSLTRSSIQAEMSDSSHPTDLGPSAICRGKPP